MGATDEQAMDALSDYIYDLGKKPENFTIVLTDAELDTYSVGACKLQWLKIQKKSGRFDTIEYSEVLTETTSPWEDIFRMEQQALLHRAIQRLDPKCQAVINSHLAEIGWRTLEEETDENENTLKQRFKRCKDKLRDLFMTDPDYKDIYWNQ